MNKKSLFGRFELLVGTATISAHANSQGRGFRQRDMRWLLEFFSNWVDTSLGEEGLEFQNTQISRYLEDLVKEGLAKKHFRRNYPRYHLTRPGLIELLSRLVARQFYPHKEHFYFLHSFLTNYGPRIQEIVIAEGRTFPYALRLELEALLNPKTLLATQLLSAKRELKKLEKRIEDQINTAKLTRDMMRQGKSYPQLITAIEKQYPYSIYTKKPVSHFFTEVTELQGLWELSVGGLRRNEQMWTQAREMLLLHIEQLERLESYSPGTPDLKLPKLTPPGG